MAASPSVFREHLAIDADGRPTPFRPDPFQVGDLGVLDPGLMAVAGRGEPPVIRKHWWERVRGASKTSDMCIALAWVLAFGARPVRAVAAAGDADQARLIRDGLETLLRCNDFLRGALQCRQNVVANDRTGAQLQIISSDVATSFGITPDMIVVDEIGHWPDGKGENLWGSLFSASAKRAHCVLIVSTNAGFQEHFAWRLRESVRGDPAWHFSRVSEPPSWMSGARVEEQRRILPAPVFDRLFAGVWSTGSGDALRPEDIAASLTLPAPPREIEDGFLYFAGVDLGVSRDSSALVIVGKHFTGRVKLVQVSAWTPTAGAKVDLSWVESACLEAHRRWRARFQIDPYQAAYLSSRMRQYGCRVEEVAFVGKALVEMASSLVEIFSTRAIDLFRDEALLSDLRRLRIKESPQGWRLDAPRTAAGHCDRATALALAVLGCRRTPTYQPGTGEGPCVLIEGWSPDGGGFGPGEAIPFIYGDGSRNRTGTVPPGYQPPGRGGFIGW
jgi:hypothetical protein